MTGDPTSEPQPAVPDLPGALGEGRAAYVISQLYYYVAAVVGVGFVIGGTIAFLFGVRTLVLPDEFQEAGDGIRTMFLGLSFAIPGLAAAWWHLRQARRREGVVASGAFWGSALYFHLVALIALFFVLGGSVGILASITNLAVPDCQPAPPVQAVFPEDGEVDLVTPMPREICHPEPDEAARGAVDAAIFVIAAGPVMWWHLRQGRRLTTPPLDAAPG